MDEELQEYREFLIAAEQETQSDIDKTILTLSGGALGISFAFVNDIVGSNPLINSQFLLGAWIAWVVSLAFVLASFYVSQLALKRAVKQVDKNQIYQQMPGGIFSIFTTTLNALGGISFLVGVALIIIFAAYNVR